MFLGVAAYRYDHQWPAIDRYLGVPGGSVNTDATEHPSPSFSAPHCLFLWADTLSNAAVLRTRRVSKVIFSKATKTLPVGVPWPPHAKRR